MIEPKSCKNDECGGLFYPHDPSESYCCMQCFSEDTNCVDLNAVADLYKLFGLLRSGEKAEFIKAIYKSDRDGSRDLGRWLTEAILDSSPPKDGHKDCCP